MKYLSCFKTRLLGSIEGKGEEVRGGLTSDPNIFKEKKKFTAGTNA